MSLEHNVRRSLALGVCESAQTMRVPSSRRHRGKSRADRVLSVVGWLALALVTGAMLAGAR